MTPDMTPDRKIGPAPQALPTSIFTIYKDGRVDEERLYKVYGLSLREAMQPVTFGSYAGTVAEMLEDARCPVGGMVRTAFQQDGIEGVRQKFEGLSALDPTFRVEISSETLERAKLEQMGKKN